MGLGQLHAKVAGRLKIGRRYPDVDAIVQKTQRQHESSLLRLPMEIRNAILTEVWAEAGAAQHILLKGGHYVGFGCVTEHKKDDGLMDQCASLKKTSFSDELIYSRLMSDWGNHWKCDELRRSSNESAIPQQRPFLAVMLACRQLYIEGRASIYSTVVFVFHNLDTLHSLTVSRPSPIIREIRHLQLAIRLPVCREWKRKMSPEAHEVMDRWRECCRALEQLDCLCSVDLWLDTVDPLWRGTLSSVTEGKANPFVFGDRLAGLLTVDLPVNPQRPEAWQDVADIRPAFAVRARGWPSYRISGPGSHSIYKIWDSAEPGSVQPPLMFGTAIRHNRTQGRPRHKRLFW